MRIKILLFLMLSMPFVAFAKDTPNARQARQMFDRTFNIVFGEQGSTLRYDINLIGIYKTNGKIWYKGKKSKFIEPRYLGWNDGTTYTVVDKKKKTVEIHRADSEQKDKYASKFKFNPENYTYNVKEETNGYMLIIKAKRGVKGIKEVKALIDKKTRYPISLHIKLAFFWTTVKISEFQSGGINEAIFKFPAASYKSYKTIDKR